MSSTKEGHNTTSISGLSPNPSKLGNLVPKEMGVIAQDEEKLGSHWEGPYIVIANH